MQHLNIKQLEEMRLKIQELETRNQQLEQENKALTDLAWNEGYGCYTRQGFEKLIWPGIADQAKWIIFFDVDNMHDLNKEHGYEGVNAIIKKTLAMRAGDFMAGQWFSGDEFIVVVTDEDSRGEASSPKEFSIRLAHLFLENGASATFTVAPVVSNDLMTNVMPAHQLCQKAKAHLQRGTISFVPGEPR
jgi:GGDEF domain-containing protein